MTSLSNSQVDLAIDLLVARAALDSDLRAELLADAEACCRANGVELPPGTRIAFTSAESDLIVRHIPNSADQEASVTYSSHRDLEPASAHFNAGVEVENTETTANVEAEVTAVGVADAAVGVDVAAGAVVVIVAT